MIGGMLVNSEPGFQDGSGTPGTLFQFDYINYFLLIYCVVIEIFGKINSSSEFPKQRDFKWVETK